MFTKWGENNVVVIDNYRSAIGELNRLVTQKTNHVLNTKKKLALMKRRNHNILNLNKPISVKLKRSLDQHSVQIATLNYGSDMRRV